MKVEEEINGRKPVNLQLCRSCLEYVYDLKRKCPHCRSSPKLESQRYRDGNYKFFEASKRIERILEKIAYPK